MAGNSLPEDHQKGLVANANTLEFLQRIERQTKDRIELEAHRRWMIENSDKWETEATDGTVRKKYLTLRQQELRRMIRERLDEEWGPVKKPTMASMRRDVAEGRKRIKKRNAVKAWLASMGVDMTEIKDAEQALFVAFDKLA